jgi:hypothetical protein
MEACFNSGFLPSKTRRRSQIVYAVNWHEAAVSAEMVE